MGGWGERSLEFKTHVTISALNFQQGRAAKASLEITYL